MSEALIIQLNSLDNNSEYMKIHIFELICFPNPLISAPAAGKKNTVQNNRTKSGLQSLIIDINDEKSTWDIMFTFFQSIQKCSHI